MLDSTDDKVSSEKVIVAVDESKEIDLPERLRLYVHLYNTDIS